MELPAVVIARCAAEAGVEPWHTSKAAAGGGLDKALLRASNAGRTDIVWRLLDRGANVDAGALRAAARNGHAAVVALLLDRGANVDANDDAELRAAAQNGREPVVALLLER